MKSIIECKNVDFSYGSNRILKGINFTINNGDFIALLGANGSGKSTLLKLILKELELKKGSIEVLGTRIEKFNEWSNIGYVPQVNISTIPSFPITALELVVLNLYEKFGFFKIPKKEHIERAKFCLKMVGLEDKYYAMINKMSGGEQQRVVIAKALVNSPRILIFDEPTVGVDKESKEILFDILTHLNRKHQITILLVTHEMEFIQHGFSRKLYLKDGILEELKDASITI